MDVPTTSITAAVGVFALTWTAQTAAWALWAALLYPKFFSPLRHLPGPSGNHWLLGQWARIRSEPTGTLLRDW
jgi:hypothetical protein